MGRQIRMEELDRSRAMCLRNILEEYGRRNEHIIHKTHLMQRRMARWATLARGDWALECDI